MADEEKLLPEPEPESESEPVQEDDEKWRLALVVVLYMIMFQGFGFFIPNEARLSFKLGSGDDPVTIKTRRFLLFALLPLYGYWGMAYAATIPPKYSLLSPFRFRVSGDGHAKLLPRVATAVSLTMFELVLESELRQGPLFPFEQHLMINLAIALIGNMIALIYEEAFSRKLTSAAQERRIKLLYFGACLAFMFKIVWMLSWTIGATSEKPLSVWFLFVSLFTWNLHFANIVYAVNMGSALKRYQRDKDPSALDKFRTFAAFAEMVLTCVWVGMSAGALVTLSQFN